MLTWKYFSGGGASRVTSALLLLSGAACSNVDTVTITKVDRDTPLHLPALPAQPQAPSDAQVTVGCAAPLDLPKARNVVVLIADGYGQEQILATRMFLNGDTEPLAFETLPYTTTVTTDDAVGGVTDSGASATAMATGQKVNQLVISRAIPGDGSDLRTALEDHQARGRAVGLVTTHIPLTDATPAAFGAHANTRYDVNVIADTLLNRTRPNVLFGGADSVFTAASAAAAGYTVVQDAAALTLVDTTSVSLLAGPFEATAGVPLQLMARTAIDVLSQDADGFFALIEQELTDTAGHAGDLPGMLSAAAEFHTAVESVLSWAEGRDDTLIVVGADHETGGLTVTETAPQRGEVPAHVYSTSVHTASEVRFFASGPGSELLPTLGDNTDLFPLLAGLTRMEYSSATCTANIAVDTVLSEAQPNSPPTAVGALQVNSIDGQQQQTLLRFDTEFIEVPVGRRLRSAALVLRARRSNSTPALLHRLLVDFTEASQWTSFGGDGVQADGVEAAVDNDASTGVVQPGLVTLDVTQSVRAWLSDPASNHGWVVLASPEHVGTYDSAEGIVPPRLLVYFE